MCSVRVVVGQRLHLLLCHRRTRPNPHPTLRPLQTVWLGRVVLPSARLRSHSKPMTVCTAASNPPASTAAVAAAPAPASEELYNYGEQHFTFVLSGICVTLINNAVGGVSTPFTQFRVNRVSSDIQAFAQRRLITAGLELSADYHNEAIVQWEPMLEPTVFAMRIEQVK